MPQWTGWNGDKLLPEMQRCTGETKSKTKGRATLADLTGRMVGPTLRAVGSARVTR